MIHRRVRKGGADWLRPFVHLFGNVFQTEVGNGDYFNVIDAAPVKIGASIE